MAGRAEERGITFVAFTATPKPKTLELFGTRPDPSRKPAGDNVPAAFHVYSMRQAIEEGFILDVLKSYTTYATYFRLLKSCEEDPNVERKKAARALARFLKLHPHNIAQKTEVMVEHFHAVTRHKIGGRAKAMVVTGSRLEAVEYKQHFDNYIKDKGYPIKSLVAFSGTVQDDKLADVTYMEEGMNGGLREKELPERFASPDRIQTMVRIPHVAHDHTSLARLPRLCDGRRLVVALQERRRALVERHQAGVGGQLLGGGDVGESDPWHRVRGPSWRFGFRASGTGGTVVRAARRGVTTG